MKIPAGTRLVRWVWFFWAALLAGCGGAATSTSPPPPTPIIRPTLPPTWTPTFTPSPAPPTATFTPTWTPSPTATPSAADLCDGLWQVTNLGTGRIFAWTARITLVVNAPPDVRIRLRLTERRSGEVRGVDFPAGQFSGFHLPVSLLAEPGLYDWSLTVQSAIHGEICPQAGWLLVTGRASTRAEENLVR